MTLGTYPSPVWGRLPANRHAIGSPNTTQELWISKHNLSHQLLLPFRLLVLPASLRSISTHVTFWTSPEQPCHLVDSVINIHPNHISKDPRRGNEPAGWVILGAKSCVTADLGMLGFESAMPQGEPTPSRVCVFGFYSTILTLRFSLLKGKWQTSDLAGSSDTYQAKVSVGFSTVSQQTLNSITAVRTVLTGPCCL